MRQNGELEASAPTDPGLPHTVLLFGYFLLFNRQGIPPQGGPTSTGWPSQVAASSSEAFAAEATSGTNGTVNLLRDGHDMGT